MWVIVLTTLLLAVYVLKTLWKLFTTQDPLSIFPSPRGGLPLVGNAFQVDGSGPHHTMYKWAQELGPIYIFWAFGKPHLVVNDREGLYEVLVTHGDDFGGRPYMYRADFAFENSECLSFQNFCPRWKALRMETHRAVKQYGDGLKSLEKISMDAIRDMLERFEDRKGEEFDPRLDLYETFTQIVIMLIIGKGIDRNDPILKEVIKFERGYCDGFTGAGDGMLLDMFPWLRHFGNKSYKILKSAVESRRKVWATYLPEIKATYVEGQERGIFDALYGAQRKQLKNGAAVVLSDTAIEMALTDIVNGGTATTTSTVYAFLNILIHNPGIQEKMYKEIHQQLGDRDPTIADKDDLLYTRAVILELLRYTTIGSLGLPHETLCDTHFLQHKIPKGTYVIPNLWAVNHDPKVWPNPWKFDPQRFLDNEGKLLPPGHTVRKGFMPFGAGTRVCVGESLAKNRLFLAVVSLVNRFEICPQLKGRQTPCDPRTYSFGGLLNPKPFTMRAVRRSAPLLDGQVCL